MKTDTWDPRNNAASTEDYPKKLPFFQDFLLFKWEEKDAKQRLT